MKQLVMAAIAAMSVVTLASAQQVAVQPAEKNAEVNANIKEEEEASCPIFFGLNLDVTSAYVWRGMVFTDEPAWQPEATIGFDAKEYGRLMTIFWANFDATGRADHSRFAGLNEIDYTVQYEVDLGDFTLGAGHIWYTFPYEDEGEWGETTRETFISVDYNNDIVVPFAQLYYDYSVYECLYSLVGLRKEVSLTDAFVAGAEVTLGGGNRRYTSAYFSRTYEDSLGDEVTEELDNKFWLTDTCAALYCTYNITENLYVGGRLAWSALVDSALHDNDYEHNDLLWGGVSCGVEF